MSCLANIIIGYKEAASGFPNAAYIFVSFNACYYVWLCNFCGGRTEKNRHNSGSIL